MALSEFPERIKRLDVTIAGLRAGELLRESTYVFKYDRDDVAQPAVSLLMPPSRALYEDGDLFPSMDMNLPEGFLFHRILEMFPKRRLTKMHLLALMGDNGIGRAGFVLPGNEPPRARQVLARETLLKSTPSAEFFAALVDAYLSTGLGISGVQPKIMVPSRTSLPVPDLIVKTAGADYPGLAANEFLCLQAARRAGIAVPSCDLSDDGQILVVDRFDVDADGTRLGFEDIAALMTLRVNDRLSTRKYQGSYEAVAQVIALVSSQPAKDLHAFFEQLAFSVMVRNGDAHLKNFALVYRGNDDARLSPMFDVVTTAIYPFERPGGIVDVDRTLALKWRSGKRHASRAYPDTDELLDFGRAVCSVAKPEPVIERIAEAMDATLREARGDDRIPRQLLADMSAQWKGGMTHAQGRRQSTSHPGKGLDPR